MIALQVADLVVIAGRVLGLGTDETIDLLDPEAAGRALMHAPPGADDDPAARAAGLLHALVAHRPFRRGNRRVALMAAVQFLAVNGWQVDLDPPEEAAAVVADLAAGRLSGPGLAAWLAPRLRPCDAAPTGRGVDISTKEASMRWLPRRRRRGPSQGMFGRFTDRARHAVMLAQEETRRLGQPAIGPEAILLGVLRERDGVGAKALESLGIDLDEVRVDVEERVGRGDGSPAGHVPYTPRAKKVLELSLREALALGHNYIGTEHVLLGLLRDGHETVAQALGRRGAGHERVRDHVVRLLTGEPPLVPGAVVPAHLREVDEQIADVRRRKDAAIDRGAWDEATALRTTEKDLLTERARREREWEAGVDVQALTDENRRLRQEIGRLNGLLREHGIEPDGGASRSA